MSIGQGTSAPSSRGPELQRLWFTLQAQPWRSLAVVATDDGADAERVAKALAAIGMRDGQTPVQVLSAVGLSFADLPRVVNQMPGSPTASAAPLTLVACDALQRNPAMIPLIQQASGVVLIVRLGQTALASVRATMAQVGRERIFATISIGETP